MSSFSEVWTQILSFLAHCAIDSETSPKPNDVGNSNTAEQGDPE